jgi:hypothetical protein
MKNQKESIESLLFTLEQYFETFYISNSHIKYYDKVDDRYFAVLEDEMLVLFPTIEIITYQLENKEEILSEYLDD